METGFTSTLMPIRALNFSRISDSVLYWLQPSLHSTKSVHMSFPSTWSIMSLIFAGSARNTAQQLVDLAGENIDALDLDHIVGSAENRIDPRVSAPAGTITGDKPCEVVRTVADERRALPSAKL
jgi:hypothetical protein